MRLLCGFLALVASALIAAGAAGAVPLGGSPLNVQVGDRGQLQAFRADRTDPAVPPGIFFNPTQPEGDAGLFLAFPDAMPPELSGTVSGFSGWAGPFGLQPYVPGDQLPPSGAGTAADPFKQLTTYSVWPFGGDEAVQIAQTTTYVNGSQEFRVHWDVKNTSGEVLKPKVVFAADFFFEGDDAGTGIFTSGPPRFVGGTNVDSGSSGGFVEVSPSWSAYQALAYGSAPNEVWGKVEGAADAATATFDNTVVGEPVDNAGGIEWDDVTLAKDEVKAFELVIRSAVPSSLQMNPTNSASRQGVPLNITATATDSVGQPYVGKTLRYVITGVNAANGAVSLGPTGSAVITDPGTNAGTDTIVAYVDFNNNGTREAVEPQASALATFVDSVPPTCTVKVTGSIRNGLSAGKPMVITVNCGGEQTPVAVTVAATLTVPPLPPRRVLASVEKKRKPKRKPKPKTIKLPSKTTTVQPGQSAPLSFTIPRSIAVAYAGRTVVLKLTVKATDTAGNVQQATVTQSIKFAKIEKKAKKKPKKRR